MRNNHRGFTLIELMISIALVLLLTVGINEVFKIASSSVGAGQAVSETTGQVRAVQSVLYNDLQQSIIRSEEMPCFIINSSWVSAFLDRQEELADQDYAAVAGGTIDSVDAAIRTIDLNNDNLEGSSTGETIPRNASGPRVFRTDMMSFFARHLFPRQTGGSVTDAGVSVEQYTADMASQEAWVWYGHLKQPPTNLNDVANNQNPGWQPLSGTTALKASDNPNNFYARQWGLGRVAMLLRPVDPNDAGRIRDDAGVAQWHYGRSVGISATSLSPLGQNISARLTTAGAADTTQRNQYSRYDLAGTTIDQFRSLLRGHILAGGTTWHGEGTGNLGYRRQGYPFPNSPLSGKGVARTVPWLIGGCSSFIVEYAGDYLEQDATGVITDTYAEDTDGTNGPDTDDTADFIVAADGSRKTRWYGMPRDTNGDGLIDPAADVVPLGTFTLAPHEHLRDIDGAFNFTSSNASYTAAWQPIGTYAGVEPPRPTMLRITLTIDDPAGRLPGGQTYEFVVELP